MLELNPNSPEDVTFALNRAVKESGLTLAEIAERMQKEYGERVSVSALSHVLWRGTIRLQRALRILAICGVSDVKIARLD